MGVCERCHGLWVHSVGGGASASWEEETKNSTWTLPCSRDLGCSYWEVRVLSCTPSHCKDNWIASCLPDNAQASCGRIRSDARSGFFFLAGYGVRMMGHTTSKLAGGHYLKKLQKDENLGMLAVSFSVPIQWMRMRWWSFFFFFSYNSFNQISCSTLMDCLFLLCLPLRICFWIWVGF